MEKAIVPTVAGNSPTFIFDLDGTLLDTLADLAAATNHALAAYGLPQRSVAEVRQMVGNGVRRLMLRAVHEPLSPDGGLTWVEHPVTSLPDGTLHPRFADIFAEFKRYYVGHCRTATALYPGVAELLAELRRRGCRMAVVSNKLQAGVTELRDAYLAEWVDIAIGEREGIARKPDPAMVLAAMAALGSQPCGTFYVGDSDVDILTAQRAGIPCVSVLWGFRDKPFLLRHGATHFAARPADILALLDEWPAEPTDSAAE